MKNNFTVEVSFKDVPDYPYEWDNVIFLTGIKVIRVKTKIIYDLLTYDAILKTNSEILILSDCKTAIALRLDKNGKVLKRSFLTFNADTDICEYATNLKCTNLEYTLLDTKLKYEKVLNEENVMKEYIVNSLKKINDENEYKYLYYLFFNEIKGYKKEKLLDFIIKDKPGNFQKLYDFLVLK